MNWEWEFFKSVLITLTLTFSSLFFGLILSIIMVYIKHQKIKILEELFNLLMYFVRGTPVLLQLYIIYYGIPTLPRIQESLFWGVAKSPWFCGILTLSLNTGCYTCYLFFKNLQKISKTQMWTGQILGLSPFQIFTTILFPQFFRNSWKSYNNEVFIMLKSTALVSVITLLEITGMTRIFIVQTYQTLEGHAIAGLLYLILSLLIYFIFQKLGAKLKLRTGI